MRVSTALALVGVVLISGCDAVLGLAERSLAPAKDASTIDDAARSIDAGAERDADVPDAGDAAAEDGGGDVADGGPDGFDAAFDTRFTTDTGPLADGAGCSSTSPGVTCDEAFSCNCGHQAGCSVACTPTVGDASPSITCLDLDRCSAACGDDCSVICSASTNCEGKAGANGEVNCAQVKESCTFEVGDDTEVVCSGAKSCDVTCTGTCSVVCSLAAACKVVCPENATGDECDVTCDEGARLCPDRKTRVCGAATCPKT